MKEKLCLWFFTILLLPILHLLFLLLRHLLLPILPPSFFTSLSTVGILRKLMVAFLNVSIRLLLMFF